MSKPHIESSGVKELIDRIRDEGVHSARAEADRILDEAKARAARIVADAKAEAAKIVQEARSTMERDQTATLEALRIAARDTSLELRSAIVAAFEEHVRRLVTDVTTDGLVIRDMILVLAGRAAEDLIQDKEAVVMLPADTAEEVSAELDSFLKHSAAAISADVLREGIELIPSTKIRGGARVRLVGEDLEVDLSDQALSEMMLKLLLPRYRKILVEAGQ